MLIQMMLLLLSSNSITHKRETTFIPFIRYFVLISLVLTLQYLYEYLRSTKKEDRNLTLKFIFIATINNNIAPFFCNYISPTSFLFNQIT